MTAGYLSHSQLIKIARGKYRIFTLPRTSDRDPRPYRACIALAGTFAGCVLFGTPVSITTTGRDI